MPVVYTHNGINERGSVGLLRRSGCLALIKTHPKAVTWYR